MKKRFIKNIISIIILMLFCEGQVPHHHHIDGCDGSYKTFFSIHSKTHKETKAISFTTLDNDMAQNILDVKTRKFDNSVEYIITPTYSVSFVSCLPTEQIYVGYISCTFEIEACTHLFSRPPPKFIA